MDGGVYVLSTAPGGPAEKYGIRPGDIVTAVDNAPVSNPGELLDQMKERSAGESVAIDLIRKGRRQRITVVAAAWPE